MRFLIGSNSSRGAFRSSRPEMFCKKGVHRIFAKFTGKHIAFFKHLADVFLRISEEQLAAFVFSFYVIFNTNQNHLFAFSTKDLFYL